MDRRTGTFLIVALVFAGIWALVYWPRDAPRPRRSERRPPPSPMFFYPTPMLNSFMSSGPGVARLGRGGPRIALEPRLFSTLAARAGDCLVSVRQVYTADRERNILLASTGDEHPVGPLHLILQVYRPGARTLKDRSLDTASVRAVDDTGAPIRSQLSPPEIAEPLEIPGGLVYLIQMNAPAPTARLLKVLEGTLVEGSSRGEVRRQPFRIEHVPLPNAPRLFGEAFPRLLSPEAARGIPAGLSILHGPRAVALAEDLRAEPAATTLPRQRLILAANRAMPLGVPTPFSQTVLRINARPGPMASILLELRLGPERWEGRVWHRDALLVALPQESGRPRRVVMLRFLRDNEALPIPERPPVIFPAPPGRPGGAIYGSVRVGERPFGEGLITIYLWRRGDAGWEGPRRAVLPIQENGIFSLPNLAPGEYRMELSPETLLPTLPRSVASGSLSEYLRSRFGIEGGRWTGQIVQSLSVRGGQKIELPPLQWQPHSPDLHARAIPSQQR